MKLVRTHSEGPRALAQSCGVITIVANCKVIAAKSSKTLKDSLVIKGPKEKTRGLSMPLHQKPSYLMPDVTLNSSVPQFLQLCR